FSSQNFEVHRFSGKKLVILFSSMSCPTCMDNIRGFWIELPQLAKSKQIKILAIATGTSRSEIKIFLRMHGVEIPVAFDQNVSVTSGLGLSHDAVVVLLVNTKGKIALAHVSASINAPSDRKKLFLKKLKHTLDLI
ncbi:MAG: TlpA family protein disulfide reductase, partial [Nitrosopumilaceae archaeon]